MGLNFRKSISLGKGLKLNLSKSGPSVSFGKSGFRQSVNLKGQARTTVGIPGTGVYYTKTSNVKNIVGGLTGKDDQEVFEKLIEKLEELMRAIEIKPSIRAYGIKEEDFLATLDEMTENAFNDQCTGANPRYPLMSEIKDLYLQCYYKNADAADAEG